MKKTLHMETRMQQRGFSDGDLDLLLNFGDVDKKGEKIFLSRENVKKIIIEKNFYLEKIKKEIRSLEKIKQRGYITTISKNNKLITVY